MTPSEGFEKWWKINAPSFGPILAWDKDNRKKQMVKDTWLVACQFQRERDAELVEHHVNGPGPLRTQLAATIREQE